MTKVVKDTGGPATPLCGASSNYSYLGMTIRDHFAGQAMLGYIGTPGVVRSMTVEEIAAYAYDVADAMIKARG